MFYKIRVKKIKMHFLNSTYYFHIASFIANKMVYIRQQIVSICLLQSVFHLEHINTHKLSEIWIYSATNHFTNQYLNS